MTTWTSATAASTNWSAVTAQDFADADGYLSLDGVSGSYASTPDSTAVSITGDIDIRVQAAADDWTPDAVQEFLAKATTDSSHFSYLLRLRPNGGLQLYWSSDGTSLLNASSTVALTVSDGASKWVRGTLDVDNGSAGRDIKFYTSDDGVSWTQLGATVTQAGVTGIFDGTALLMIGQRGAGSPFAGKIYYAEVRNGIVGTVVAKFDPSGEESDTASFTSSTGEVWTINGTASIVGYVGWRSVDEISTTWT